MKYIPQNNGLLSINDVKQNDKITILDEACITMSKGKEYWNCKIELQDGTHKLAGVGGITGDLFNDAWGDETRNWIGKVATVDIRVSYEGKSYIVLVPVKDEVVFPLDEPPMIIQLPPDTDEMDVKDIPF